MCPSLTAEKNLAHWDISLYFNDRYMTANTIHLQKDKSLHLHINPPPLSLSWYGSKSLAKCFVVIPLLSLLWTIRHKSTPSLRAFKTKGATHDHKRQSHLWNVLITWVVQRKTICLITSNWFGLTVKASVCGPVSCAVSCGRAGKRSNFSDVQLSQLTAKAKASWMLLNLGEAKH